MSNSWFRLYSDIMTNTKVLVLPEALRWRYVALLCMKCNGDYDETPDDEICLALRISLDEWEKTKAEFVKRKLLNEDGKICGWEKRQYISDLKDPTAAERQKRYRASKNQKRNASVTSRLPESDTDTDTDINNCSERNDSEQKDVSVFIELPLNGKSQVHRVTELDVKRYQELYPAVDIPQELRNMRGWLDGNPAKRKTATGIERFINTWLAKSQNSGGTPGFVKPQAKANDEGLPPGYRRVG